MEQLSDEELDHAAEEDSDKEDQDLDKMFGAWLGELDKLTQSLDDGKPEKVRKSPLRQETNLANFSYRFSMYNINEALNQGDAVDLDALMADLCSIEQELSTIGSKPNSTGKAAGTAEGKVRQKPPAGRQGSARGTSSSARVSPSSTVRGPKPLTTNFSLDDITAQLEQASLSMDEAARQSPPPPSSSSSFSSSSFCLPPPAAHHHHHHRRTGSAGTVSDHDARSVSNSSRSSVASAASSMDSLDIDKVLRPPELEGLQQGQPSSEHAPLRRPSKQVRRHLDFAQEEVEVDLNTDCCFVGVASLQSVNDCDRYQNALGLCFHTFFKKQILRIIALMSLVFYFLFFLEEQAAKLKAEKIRVALEKIKEAQVKKLVIRVHMSDESSKTMMVDERQTVRQVLDSLLDKSHCGYSPDWALVETIPELQMERIFEDHENLVENLQNWTRDSQNKLMFIERIEKYALFKNPQNYLLGKKETSEMADRNKEALLEECFCGSSVTVPEIEGVLWLKEDGKKSWKKRYFLLRASGIYFVPKGKAKVSRDLVCFLQLDHVNVYYGQDYRNKYKAPSDYCLALKTDTSVLFCEESGRLAVSAGCGPALPSSGKEGYTAGPSVDFIQHPQIQKKSQYIKYLCCDDVRTLHQWVNGIRIAKYGRQLYVNYQEAMKRTEAAYDWSSLSSSSMKSGSSSSSLPESHSNHSNQSDSGVSDTQSSGHVRSQSIVSSIFSEAWKRGTQMEETSKVGPPPHVFTVIDCSGSGMRPDGSVTPNPKQSFCAPLEEHENHTCGPTLGLTPLLFSRKALGSLMTSKSGSLAPPAGPTNTSSSSILSFSQVVSHPGTGQTHSCLASVGCQLTREHIPMNDNCIPQHVPQCDLMSKIVRRPASGSVVLYFLQRSSLCNTSTVTHLHERSVKLLQSNGTPSTQAKSLFLSNENTRAESGQSGLDCQAGVVLYIRVRSHWSCVCSGSSRVEGRGEGNAFKIVLLSPFLSSFGVCECVGKSVCNLFLTMFYILSQKAEVWDNVSVPLSNLFLFFWSSGELSYTVVFKKTLIHKSTVSQENVSKHFINLSQDHCSARTNVSCCTSEASMLPSNFFSPFSLFCVTSSPGGKKPPPTPQRNSSIKSNSSAEYHESKKVENLVSKFGQPCESPSPSSSGSPSKDLSAGPPAPPKPGKLNLSNLPMFPQGKGGPAKEPTSDFPSPPSDYDYFPPPPPDSELLPPPPADPPSGTPKVAVVNPQPQAWNKASLKKTPPPTLPKRNDSTRLTQGEVPEPPTTPPPHQQAPPPGSQAPTSPKGNLSVQPNFLADLNRTLQRKSITRHSSLSSSRMSKLEPAATMDDMALPPPPPELLLDQQKQGSYMSGNISGYATLRRGPPPAPPKRDQSTKLTGDW
ncbi:RAPH1 protein, partial [Atractosteus spatula]|nr:RAPH1 protein [Atractosteus spatula]